MNEVSKSPQTSWEHWWWKMNFFVNKILDFPTPISRLLQELWLPNLALILRSIGPTIVQNFSFVAAVVSRDRTVCVPKSSRDLSVFRSQWKWVVFLPFSRRSFRLLLPSQTSSKKWSKEFFAEKHSWKQLPKSHFGEIIIISVYPCCKPSCNLTIAKLFKNSDYVGF